MPTASRPNILFIVLDTTRRDHLSAYGYQRETSPHFDAFASRAATFDRAVSAAQWTIPSHASLFTGTYPSTHAVTQADSVLSGMHPTLAEILSGAGYHTVAFCNNPLVGVLNNGLQRGFRKFYNYASAAPTRPKEERQSPLRRAVLRNFRRYVARPIGNQFAKSDLMFRLAMTPAVVPFWTKLIHYNGDTGASVDDLMHYWQAHHAGGNETPLFAFLNVMGAHLPYTPPQTVLDRLAPNLTPAQYRFVRRFNSEAARWASPPDKPLEDWQRAALDAFYDAEIAHQDAHIGRLLQRLEETGALANTVVVIAADHGEGHGDHGFFGHGFVAYQELVHVPLAIHWPDGTASGKRIAANISTRRLFHTLLEAAGIHTPPLDEADPNARVDGLTLRRAAEGQADDDHGLALAEAIPPQMFLGVIRTRNAPLLTRLALDHARRGLYRGDYKLALLDDTVEGVFHLPSDPREMQPLGAEAEVHALEMRRAARHIIQQAEQWRSQSDDFTLDESELLAHLRALGYIE